jgi:hypothetical protein
MNILPYKLETTNDQLTSRAGLLTLAHLIDKLELPKRIDNLFPLPNSNRGINPSVYMLTLIMMQHEGSFHLDDVRHLEDDTALRMLLGMKKLPKPTSIGDWLRKTGAHQMTQHACQEINKVLLTSALHKCKHVLLDIDATEIIANKSSAEWTYKSNKGYMPMVGHIAQTGQVLACNFRKGNQSPNSNNLEFIWQCQEALPKGCQVKFLRIDAAGYQVAIIKYCDEERIHYAIRAVMSSAIKEQIQAAKESDWQPMLNKKGEIIKDQQTLRIHHWIGDYDNPFTLVIQRKHNVGQGELDLGTTINQQEIIDTHYIYRAIATNREDLNDSKLIHWYNQRGEDSENRIKELKHDFGAETLPCSDFKANALYFNIAALSYNLFALMRQLLPEPLAHHRVITIRWRLYAMAAKVVKTGRQCYVKLKRHHHVLLAEVLEALRRFEPPPI